MTKAVSRGALRARRAAGVAVRGEDIRAAEAFTAVRPRRPASPLHRTQKTRKTRRISRF